MSDALPLLGHTNARNPAFTLSGTGAEFVSDVRLGGENPGVLTRIQWLSEGSPAIGNNIKIRAEFSRAYVPRLACLLGLSKFGGTLSDGQKLEVRGKRVGDAGFTYDLGGDSQDMRTETVWNGSIGAWFALAGGLDPIIGYEFTIYNDFDGATELTADDFLQLGTAQVFEAVEFEGLGGYRWGPPVNPSVKTRTLGSQMHRVVRVPYRQLTFSVAPMQAEEAHLSGLTNGTNWDRVNYALSQGPCAIMLRPGTDLQQAESAYCDMAELGELEQLAYRLSQGNGWRAEEIPAQPA